MDTYNPNEVTPSRQPETSPSGSNHSGRVMGGLVIVAVGVLFLAKKTGVDFPHWLFSFETFLIAFGLYIGFRHSFRSFGWLIPIVIGGALLLDDLYPYYNLSQFTWPILIIGFGLFVIFRPNHRKRDRKTWRNADSQTVDSSDDFLDSTVIFGGMKKNVMSKTFRGGETVTIFGGTEINLMHADVSTPIVIEITQIFGGTKLIVPAHWKVESKDLVAILGGVDDKRHLLSNPAAGETNKVLILHGTCLLGGIEIKSY
jgi:predicted membrane protein